MRTNKKSIEAGDSVSYRYKQPSNRHIGKTYTVEIVVGTKLKLVEDPFAEEGHTHKWSDVYHWVKN